MNTIHIHAGLPKCGSTALQFILASNRERMAELGVFYPENGRDGVGHMPLTTDLIEATREKHESPMLRQMLAEFAASGAPTLVLSSEGFAVRSNKFGPAAFGDLLADAKVNVTIFVRRRDEWVRSFYKQSVKSVSRLYSKSLRSFVESPNKRLGAGFIAAASERFAELVAAKTMNIINLDLEKKGTPELFGAIVGIPLETFAGSPEVLNGRKAIQFTQGLPINLAFSDALTLYIAHCNTRDYNRRQHHYLRVALSEIDASDIAPNLRLLDPQLSETLLRDGAADEARLSERFNAPAVAFTPKVESGADYRQELTAEEIAEIDARVAPRFAALLAEVEDKKAEAREGKDGDRKAARQARKAARKESRAEDVSADPDAA